jgi:hypothetical protein
MKDILNSHPVAVLKKEISKSNIKGYSKMKKPEIVALMLKHKDKFSHIKMAEKKERKPRSTKEQKPKKKVEPKKSALEILIPGININKDKDLKPLSKEFIPDENNLKDMKKYKKILDKKNKDKKISKGEYERTIKEVNKQIKKLEKEQKPKKKKKKKFNVIKK